MDAHRWMERRMTGQLIAVTALCCLVLAAITTGCILTDRRRQQKMAAHLLRPLALDSPIPLERHGDNLYARIDDGMVYVSPAPEQCPHGYPLLYRGGKVLSLCPWCAAEEDDD